MDRFDHGNGYEHQDCNRRTNSHGYGEFKLKMDFPPFNGTLHIEEFIEWMAKVERFFDYMNIDEDKQVKLVVLRLKGCLLQPGETRQ